MTSPDPNQLFTIIELISSFVEARKSFGGWFPFETMTHCDTPISSFRPPPSIITATLATSFAMSRRDQPSPATPSAPIAPLSPFYNPTSQQLRKLILSYLYHHCYVSTAKVFANSKDMNTLLAEAARRVPQLSGDGDEPMGEYMDNTTDAGEPDDELLKQVCLRRDIRDHILCGRIDPARQLLDTHFPAVLNPPPGSSWNSYTASHPSPSPFPSSAAFTSSPYSSLPPRGNLGSRIIGSAGARLNLPTMNPPNATPPPNTASSNKPSTYTFPLSLDPRHLSLNLQIQSFIESVRTKPLIPPPSSLSSTTVYTPPDPFPSPNPPKILALAQELYFLATSLPPADQDVYLREVGNVGALMAYQVPEESSVAKYLTMFRREAVADQINSAILFRTSQAPVPFVQQYAEHTTLVWSMLEELGATLPSPSSYPPGVAPPPPMTSAIRSTAVKVTDTPVTKFDLSKFVATMP